MWRMTRKRATLGFGEVLEPQRLKPRSSGPLGGAAGSRALSKPHQFKASPFKAARAQSLTNSKPQQFKAAPICDASERAVIVTRANGQFLVREILLCQPELQCPLLWPRKLHETHAHISALVLPGNLRPGLQA